MSYIVHIVYILYFTSTYFYPIKILIRKQKIKKIDNILMKELTITLIKPCHAKTIIIIFFININLKSVIEILK